MGKLRALTIRFDSRKPCDNDLPNATTPPATLRRLHVHIFAYQHVAESLRLPLYMNKVNTRETYFHPHDPSGRVVGLERYRRIKHLELTTEGALGRWKEVKRLFETDPALESTHEEQAQDRLSVATGRNLPVTLRSLWVTEWFHHYVYDDLANDCMPHGWSMPTPPLGNDGKPLNVPGILSMDIFTLSTLPETQTPPDLSTTFQDYVAKWTEAAETGRKHVRSVQIRVNKFSHLLRRWAAVLSFQMPQLRLFVFECQESRFWREWYATAEGCPYGMTIDGKYLVHPGYRTLQQIYAKHNIKFYCTLDPECPDRDAPQFFWQSR